jgi:hypothetical protein
MGALLVSPFNVKWRCYAQAGGVEESKFLLPPSSCHLGILEIFSFASNGWNWRP